MIRQVYHAETYSLTGKIENIVGMSIEASGGQAAVGDICRIYNSMSRTSSIFFIFSRVTIERQIYEFI